MKKILMTNCKICGNRKDFIKKYKILKQCMKCSHIFADIELKYQDIKKIYSDKYFFGDEYINYIDDKKQIEKNALIRLKTIKKYIKNLSQKKIFEIGCAYGFFLNIVKNNFKKVSGIDVNEKGIQYIKNFFNLKVFCDDFLNLDKETINDYDIFCMFDVIEHLNDPNKVIKKISNESKIGSYIVLTTGDISSFNAKINGANWRLIHPPSHLHYFNRRSITKLLEKNNFELVLFTHCGYYRNLNFILNKINFIRKYFNFIIHILMYFKILKHDIYLNLFDIMLVIAKKIK